MCSYFQHRMENHQGDLTDIVRAAAAAAAVAAAAGGGSLSIPTTNWQFPLDPIISPSGLEELLPEDFGNPFSNMRDPILQEVHLATSGLPNNISFQDSASFGCGGGFLSEKIKLPVPPRDMPAPRRGITASPVLPNSTIGSKTTKTCLVQSTDFQISSPPNTGAKRRKNQAKKVVCVPAPAPAPAPANNRPGGEVVPSDLWAWRKYGQKPIKGSPYPRGYYRCSSSKGCSARKQVERSRTDPNMLVITYTSEHNHPWPTQRNALAGSTRSQPAKSNAASKNSPGSEGIGCTKEEEKESNNDNMSCSPSIITGSSTTNVKEEMEELEAQMDMDDEGGFSGGFNPLFERPANHLQCEDFFADLGELLEAEPVNLLFSQQGFSAHEERESKSLDPSNIYGGWKSSNYTAFGDQPGTGRGH